MIWGLFWGSYTYIWHFTVYLLKKLEAEERLPFNWTQARLSFDFFYYQRKKPYSFLNKNVLRKIDFRVLNNQLDWIFPNITCPHLKIQWFLKNIPTRLYLIMSLCNQLEKWLLNTYLITIKSWLSRALHLYNWQLS